MSNRSEIAVANTGLFSLHVIDRYVNDTHKKVASDIRRHFLTEKRMNPSKLSASALRALSEGDTEDYFIRPILQLLGYVFRKGHGDTRGKFPDFWLFSEEPESTEPAFLQRNNLCVLEAKAYSATLDFGDGRKETPPEQLAQYIQMNIKHNPHKKWGILTNGFKWRLYSDIGRDKFIEFDLDHALESPADLERFCAVFSPDSFAIPASRKTLLDNIRDESLASWTAITNLIEKRANEILLSLIDGLYVESKNLDFSKDVAYDILYKCFFILHVESKGILPVSTSSYGAVSFRQILFDLNVVSFSEYEIGERLRNLFVLFSEGNKFLPKGFGGEHFASVPEFKIKNKYLKSALEGLTVFEQVGDTIKFFDFSSLNVELIGDVYESTLKAEFVVDNKSVKLKHAESKTGTKAHSSGTTYTPSSVVTYLVSEAFKAKKFAAIPAVCDPACGSGHFLIEALRQLCKLVTPELTQSVSMLDHKRILATKAIFGADRNSLATKLCRLMLSIETMKKGEAAIEFDQNIKSFDSLLTNAKDESWLKMFESPPKGGFDFVLGNPPYVRADEPGQIFYRKQIKDTGFYSCLYKKWDLFIPFIELGIELTKNRKGTLAYVVGDGITYAPYAGACTESMSKSKHIRFVSHFDEPFSGWAFPGTCFVYDWRYKGVAEARFHDSGTPNNIERIAKADNAFLAQGKAAVSGAMQKWQGLTFGDVAYISVGMVLNLHEKFKGIHPNFEKDDLIRQQQNASNTHPIRYIENDDIGSLVFLSKNKKFLEYGPKTRVPKFIRRATFPELHEGRRILLSSSKKGRAAIIVDEASIVSHNTIVLKKWSDATDVVNKSIMKKLKQIGDKRSVSDIKALRKYLNEIGKNISYELLVGILNSQFFVSWIAADKRHKHVVVPDVITEMPIPLIDGRGRPDNLKKFDLAYANYVSKIEEKAEVVFYIEELVKKIRLSSQNEIPMLRNYLDALVERLYAIDGMVLDSIVAA